MDVVDINGDTVDKQINKALLRQLVVLLEFLVKIIEDGIDLSLRQSWQSGVFALGGQLFVYLKQFAAGRELTAGKIFYKIVRKYIDF